MYVPMKDLCVSFPRSSYPQSPLDNVAGHIFFDPKNDPFVQSSIPPSQRYGVKIDQTILDHHNTVVKGFSNYGPNEKYLINKILFTPKNLLFIIGGIGVGKTRFSKFFIDEVLPDIEPKTDTWKKHGPCAIYFDFLNDGNSIPATYDSEKIKSVFIDLLCDRIMSELNSKKLFTIDDEVGDIWENIITKYMNSTTKPPAVSFIMNEIREQEAEYKDIVNNLSRVLNIRKEIRKKILGEEGKRISYVGLLLEYARTTYFDSNPAGLIIIIDNVDRENSMVQQQVKLVIKPFVRNCGGRVIINLRQSTFYQQFDDDGFSDLVDSAPYCGPSAIEVMKAKLSNFFINYIDYAEYYNPDQLPNLVDGLKYFYNNYINTEVIVNLFKNLCGRSVRRSLVLAQNIVNNSVYDPSKITQNTLSNLQDTYQLKIGDILRAILVGPDDIFYATPNNIIDNIFEVFDFPGKSFFIKLRLLKLLKHSKDKGVSIMHLIDILNDFGYSLPLICDSINEMKSDTKRLIWSDAVKDSFRNEEHLISHGQSRLYITTTGEGYLRHLSSDLAYIQEIMLDTKVDDKRFGNSWHYDLIEDRFELIQRFLTLLSETDRNEVSKFSTCRNPKDYLDIFGDDELLSKVIVKKVKDSVDRILHVYIEAQKNGERKDYYKDFYIRHMTIYKDRIITLENFEETVFK